MSRRLTAKTNQTAKQVALNLGFEDQPNTFDSLKAKTNAALTNSNCVHNSNEIPLEERAPNAVMVSSIAKNVVSSEFSLKQK